MMARSRNTLSELLHPSAVLLPIASPLGLIPGEKLREHVKLELLVSYVRLGRQFEKGLFRLFGIRQRVFDALYGHLDEGLDQCRLLRCRLDVGDDRQAVELEELAGRNRIHLLPLGQKLRRILIGEDHRRIDRARHDFLTASSRDRHFRDLAALQIGQADHGAVLFARGALDVDADLLSTQVGHLRDVLCLQRIDHRGAFLEKHRGRHQGNAGFPSTRDRRDVSDCEGSFAGAHRFHRHGRSLTCDNFEIDTGLGKPALLLGQIKERVLGAGNPVEANTDLLSCQGLSACKRGQDNRKDAAGQKIASHQSSPKFSSNRRSAIRMPRDFRGFVRLFRTIPPSPVHCPMQAARSGKNK